MPLQTLIKQSMKTVTLIISSLFLFMALGVSAQQHGPQHRGQRGHMNPEEMVKKQVEQMKTELKLNEQQEKQVKDLFTENLKKREELMKKYQGQRDSVMVYMKKMEDLSLKKILTEEQYKTYLTNLEKRKQEMEKRRKEMMDKRGGQRGGHGAPATVNEDHECNGCGGCGKHK